MEVNKKYYIKLTTITPLSVGAGNEEEWVKCADYVIKDGKVYVLDLHKVAEAGIDLTQLSLLFVNNDHNGVVTLLGNNIEAVSARIFDLPCTSDNNIKAFERSQLHDLPVVAGSSLKGAIHSVLFNHLRDFETDHKSVFGEMKDGSDFMRFIKVGDFEMPGTQLFNSKIFNLHKVDNSWYGGWKHALTQGTNDNYRTTGFNTLYECVAPAESGYGTITFSPQLYQNVLERSPRMAHADRKSELMNGGLNKLFAIINAYTKRYLTKELAFFNKYPADRSGEIIDNIKNLLNMIPADNSSCLIKMSAGVGFHAITGDWQFEDYSVTGIHESGRNLGKKKYKSRKTVDTSDGLSLMGFVMLTEATESDYRSRMAEIETSFNAKIQSIVEQKAEAQAAAAERIRLETEKEARYTQLIQEAKDAEINKDYITVVAKAEEALKLFFSRKEAQDLIDRNKANKEAQRLSKIAEELITQTDVVEKPLAEDICYARISNIKTFIGRCKKRKAEIETPEGQQIVRKWMEAFFANASRGDRNRMKDVSKWKDIPISQETLASWIAEILTH